MKILTSTSLFISQIFILRGFLLEISIFSPPKIFLFMIIVWYEMNNFNTCMCNKLNQH